MSYIVCEKQKLLNCVCCIKGQVEVIEWVLEEECGCNDVL